MCWGDDALLSVVVEMVLWVLMRAWLVVTGLFPWISFARGPLTKVLRVEKRVLIVPLPVQAGRKELFPLLSQLKAG